jgi:hypothetical protein
LKRFIPIATTWSRDYEHPEAKTPANNAVPGVSCFMCWLTTITDEAGSADLAMIESEIKKLDDEIDDRVYELYGLTPAEIKVVEDAAK